MKKNLLSILFGSFCLITSAQINVNYTISPQSGRSSISPLIYGFNWTQTSNYTTGQNYSLVRMGGNRATAYNWENNASNAGTDWQNSSDNFWCDYLGIPSSQSEVPGIGMTTVIDQARSNNGQALITVPMAGYASADKSGSVTTTAPGSRWCQVVPAKGSAFSLNPDLTDGKVYVDEFVNFLKNKYGSGGVKYSLDNEPDLWKSTHPLVHPDAVTCQELIEKTTATAKAVKAVDGNAEIYGFVSYGFTGYMTLQDASDWSSVKGSYSWFIDYYLDKMKSASNTAGTRLVDVMDLHWYPEATGDQRIINSGANSDNDKKARLQAPRTLWDADYTENSWIGQWFSSYLPLLTRLQTSISTYYTGTKLAFTEFQYGGFEDITGAISLADVLGIFGKYGVYAATHWENPGTYGSLAYKLYRNYDDNNSTYGDVNVSATMNDKVNSSVYASVTSGSDNTLHVIALNKSMTSAINGTFTISGSSINYTSASVYAVNNGTASVSKKGDITISGNSFTYSLPALSAFHFILKAGSTTTYTIAASAGTGGSITPSGSVIVNQGANQTFSIAANTGFTISNVTVDGTAVGAVSTYTFPNVNADHTIAASFVAIPTYTITATAGTGGTITPSGNVSINQGANQSFAIAASSGYKINDVAVDGISVGAAATYTFSNVTVNHTITASFVIDNSCNLLTKYAVPRTSSLPTLNSSYNHSYTLGTGGPSLSNVNPFTINWDLPNKGLWQFSMNTTNGIPTWWLDLLPKISQTFASPSPACTLTGTGISGLDGDYWATVDGVNFVMVAKSGAYALYFTNGDAPTGCPVKSAHEITSLESSDTDALSIFPNPVDKNGAILLNFKPRVNEVSYYISDLSGKTIISGKTTSGIKSIELNGKLSSGIYFLRINNGNKQYNQKLIVK